MNKTSKGCLFKQKDKNITSYWKKSNITRLAANIVTELVYCKTL